MLMRMVPLLALIGCTIAEEDFPDAYADAVCDRLYECDRGDYENRYDDAEECKNEWAYGVELWMDAEDLLGGEYAEEAARDCISGIREADCGDLSFDELACSVYE